MSDYACCIYPCTPFLRSQDLLAAFKLMEQRGFNFVYPVVEYAHPIQRAMYLKDCKPNFLYPENQLVRTQDLNKTYHDAGQFYWGQADAWLEHRLMHSDGGVIQIPGWRSVDIDTTEDWTRAEILFQTMNNMGLMSGED